MAHKSVLLKEVMEAVAPVATEGAVIFEGTAGEGGYSKELSKHLGEFGRLIITDLDEEALERTEATLEGCPKNTTLLHRNFREIASIANEEGVDAYNAIVLDLGLSSYQLDESGRGFTFRSDEPLTMTFQSDPTQIVVTARGVVNDWTVDTLRQIITVFGGDRYGARIAKAIVAAREKEPIETTGQLVDVIQSVLPGRGKLNPATKTFQAIRMAVNDEMGALEQVLADGWERLANGGRIIVVSFHEHEDRLVKNFSKEKKELGEAQIITKKPISPSESEIKENPRSRSAKLRIIQKIK